MIKLPRYRMTNNFGHQDNENGAWVRHEDHVAALELHSDSVAEETEHTITVIALATPPGIRVASLALEKV